MGLVPTRALGSQGLKASAQGLGCMGMSAFYTIGEQDEEGSLATLKRAQELGVTMLDTADVYGVGKNEQLISKALVGSRDKYVVATKFGNVVDADGHWGVRGDRDHIREACDKSLKDLGIEVIDLYYMHRVDPKTPIEETVKAMAELVKEGKVKYIGLSEVSPDQIRRAHAVHPISAVQLEWSLWTRDMEAEVVPTCRELGIGIVAYSPLGRGFLTGEIKSQDDLPDDDFRKGNPRFQGQAFQQNLKLVGHVKDLAAKKGATPSQVALAWLHAQGDDVFPIPGTKRVKRLEENAGALDVKLTPEEVEALSRACPPGAAVGQRYHEAHMAAAYDPSK